MSANTSIEWTDHTHNIAWGCFKVSPGCAHCYASTFSKRVGLDIWGPAKTTARRTFGEKYWRKPIAWNAAAEAEGVRKRVFCSSMADVFEDHPTIDAERAKLWPLIRATPWLDWQLLTKRPERIAANLPDDWGAGYPNVWLGTSVESQEYADARIPHLLAVPAVVRFLSCEPLLGPVNLSRVCLVPQKPGSYRAGVHVDALCGLYYESGVPYTGAWDVDGPPPAADTPARRIDWVIAGGESGPGARPMGLEWARALRYQCEEAGVPYFLKQLGGVRDKRGGEAAVLDGRRSIEMPAAVGACEVTT